MTTDPGTLARRFRVFCDGLEASGAPGMHEYARRGRVIAVELLQALEQLDAESSARRAMQDRYEAVLPVLARLAGGGAVLEAYKPHVADRIVAIAAEELDASKAKQSAAAYTRRIAR